MWNLILASIQVRPRNARQTIMQTYLTFFQAIIQVMTVVILGFIFAKAGHFNMDKQKVTKLQTKGQGINSDSGSSHVRSGYRNSI
jgi:hypothetical protein